MESLRKKNLRILPTRALMVKELLCDCTLMTKASTIDAETKLSKVVYQSFSSLESQTSTLLNAIVATKESIAKSLASFDNFDPSKFTKAIEDINKKLGNIESRISVLEGKTPSVGAKQPPKAEEDFDLFGDDDDTAKPVVKKAEPAKSKKAEPAKSKKPASVARSALIIEVKPLDDETNMEELEQLVRSVKIDGLDWGKSELVPVCYGIKKLVIGVRVEDDKVAVDDIEDALMAHSTHIQSMDVVSFNKAD